MRSSRRMAAVLAGIVLPLCAQAAAEMVEIEVRFVKATRAQAATIFSPELLRLTQQAGSEPPPVVPGAPAFLGLFSPEQAASQLKECKKSGAEIQTAPRTVAVSGHRARIQNVREFRYPSKYSDPNSEGKVVPIAFATTPVGLVMEFEPTIGEDHTIDLRISPMITELTGYTDYSGTAAPSASTSPVWLPHFKKRGLTTRITLSPGQTAVFYSTGEKSSETWEFIFVTARLLPSS